MADTKEKPVRLMTPKGVAEYPWLNKADTKFKAEGEYRVKLRMDRAAASDIIEKLQAMHDKAVADSKAAFAKNPKNKGKKWGPKVHDFYEVVVDDDGNETGEVRMNFKRTASGVSAKSGKPWEIKPDLFDRKGGKLDGATKIFGGSEMKIAFSVNAYDKPIGCGISLRLEAAQVIKVESGARSADSYGFGAEAGDDDDDDATPAPQGEESSDGDPTEF